MLKIDTIDVTIQSVQALRGFSLDVDTGSMVGLVGRNGAGKTTTMRIVLGVLSADAGSVTVDGAPVDAAMRRRIGYMPADRGLYPKMRVGEQLTYLARLHGLSAPAAAESVARWTERLGVGDRLGDAVDTLSTGNQQRVQLAAALVHDPDLLVLDEPFSGLDPTAVDAMADLLREHTRRGVPVLFSSHQLDLVDRLCDRLVIMARGRVVAAGTVDELRAGFPPRHRLVVAGDAGWTRDVRGVHVVDVDGGTALVEAEDGDPGADGQVAASLQALLREAVRRDTVLEFGPVVPPLSELYREVAA